MKKKNSNIHMKKHTIFIITLLFSVTIVLPGTSITIPSPDCNSISKAIIKVNIGDTIWVKDGIYKEQVRLSSGITLISLSLFKSVLDAAGNEHGIVMGNNSSLSGFEIKNARIGVYSEGTNNTITKCFIHDNQQSGIVAVGHLPLISDNIIVENGGSGIQGWDVRSTIATINHNTIAFNSNNGISIGGNSDIVVENNICAFNEKLGLKVEPGVKVHLIRNNFYLNAEVFSSLPSNNFTFDPMFVSATTMNYMISENSKCRNMATDNKNLGARIIY